MGLKEWAAVGIIVIILLVVALSCSDENNSVTNTFTHEDCGQEVCILKQQVGSLTAQLHCYQAWIKKHKGHQNGCPNSSGRCEPPICLGRSIDISACE